MTDQWEWVCIQVHCLFRNQQFDDVVDVCYRKFGVQQVSGR